MMDVEWSIFEIRPNFRHLCLFDCQNCSQNIQAQELPVCSFDDGRSRVLEIANVATQVQGDVLVAPVHKSGVRPFPKVFWFRVRTSMCI